MSYVRYVLLLAQLLTATSLAQAGIIVPAELNPGDHYYLAFLTQGRRNATSVNIADYDQFVQGEAALSPMLTGTADGVQWKALGSTSSVNAIDHLALTNAPIFLLDGTTKVLSSGNQLFSPSTLQHLTRHPIALNQFALQNQSQNPVWTGTAINGTAYPGAPLGATFAQVGRTDAFDQLWVQFYADLNLIDYHFYAFSERLTVQVVPEPTSLTLWTIGIGCLTLYRRRE